MLHFVYTCIWMPSSSLLWFYLSMYFLFFSHFFLCFVRAHFFLPPSWVQFIYVQSGVRSTISRFCYWGHTFHRQKKSEERLHTKPHSMWVQVHWNATKQKECMPDETSFVSILKQYLYWFRNDICQKNAIANRLTKQKNMVHILISMIYCCTLIMTR